MGTSTDYDYDCEHERDWKGQRQLYWNGEHAKDVKNVKHVHHEDWYSL